MRGRYQPKGQVQDGVPVSTQVLTLGEDHTVSFASTSQFTAQGVSACGLAAFNFARIGFRIEQSKKNVIDVLNELSTREVIEEIMAICAGWSSNSCLEVDDIHRIPLFSRSLQLMTVEYSCVEPKFFRDLLEYMSRLETSAVMIITRPPEIIACFRFANANGGPRSNIPEKSLFVVFDSNPRPSHLHRAGLSSSTSIESTARTLSDILPAMDESVFDSSDFQWQAQLLSNCSARVYVAKHQRKDHEEAIFQVSLTILALRAQNLELQRENETLGTDKKQLESEVNRLRVAAKQAHMMANHEAPSLPRRSFSPISHAVAGPSRLPSASVGGVQMSSTYNRSTDTDTLRAMPVQRPHPARPSSAIGVSGAQSIYTHNPLPVPSKAPPYDDFDFYDEPPPVPSKVPPYDDLDFDDKPPPVPSKVPLYNDLDFDDDSSTDSDSLWSQTANVARELQNEFDSEDRWLRQEHEELIGFIQTTFQCGICMDELPEDDVAEVDECVHTMCRSWKFVSSKIQEHRYPIVCPMCTITTERKEQPGAISRLLIEQLGISEEQLQILTEMELAEFIVQIHCRKCRRPSFVDREDYSDAINIMCPRQDCQHIWCKKCEQTIVIDGPKHSCDGSSELDHLMKEKGWKHCPNCKTPIQKDTGCNHMTCISPGCNTHFCYVCGGMIARSALSNEIGQAVSAHFRKCRML